MTKGEALKKLASYCAYQERCHKEVRAKLLDLGIYGDDLEEIIVELINENFLNEERYAKSYARGKIRFKKWGRMRIKRELKMRSISAYCVKKAMVEVEEAEYLEILESLIKKKNRELSEPNLFHRKGKIAKYIIQKGWEASLVWEMIHDFDFDKMED